MSSTHFSGKFLYDLFRGMDKYSLSYVYKGNLDHYLTERILTLAETNMAIAGESTAVQKRVFFIMVESLQNITRHQESGLGEVDEHPSFFVMQNLDREYNITSGNVIESEKVEDLRNKLEKVNAMGADELKDYFREVITTTGISEKGGAGLGLIEMARRSGNKLAFEFQPVNDAVSYFYFQVKISPGQASPEEEGRIAASRALHDLTREKNISLIYQGLFTHQNLKSLLSMTEGGVVAGDNVGFRKKSVNIMIELLQNISHHGAQPDKTREGRPGVLLVSYRNGECLLSAGNYIMNKNVNLLRSKLTAVNNANEKELDRMYAEIIMRDDEAGAKGAGLGFVDMKMKSGKPLEFDMIPVDEQISFFTLQVKVSN